MIVIPPYELYSSVYWCSRFSYWDPGFVLLWPSRDLIFKG